jgi:general secretion pathway protein N
MAALRLTLGLAAGALATLCVVEALTPAPPISRAAALEAHVTAAPAPAGGDGSRSDDSAVIATIAARPLFRPDRRPVAVVAQNDAALPRLSGILIGPSLRIAIFTPGEGPTRLVRQGGSIGVYRVATISAHAVTLTAPGVRLVLTPRFAGAAPDAPADAPSPQRFAPLIQTPGRH